MFNVKRLTDFIVAWHGIKSEGYRIARDVVKELRRLERENSKLRVELKHTQQALRAIESKRMRDEELT